MQFHRMLNQGGWCSIADGREPVNSDYETCTIVELKHINIGSSKNGNNLFKFRAV